MNSIIYKVYFCLFVIIFFNGIIGNVGDPFDFIHSDVILINDCDTFIQKVSQEDKIIIVFSYLNNHYGDSDFDFSNMAILYSNLKKQFATNKNIEFYRAHMSQGISGLLLEPISPSMQIYHLGIKIKSINGRKEKSILFKAIIEALRNNLNKGIFEENEYNEYSE